MRHLVAQLYRTKMILSSLLLVGLGIILIAVGNALIDVTSTGWITFIPWSELGGILVAGGPAQHLARPLPPSRATGH